jgi:hypothetical protein
VHDTGLTLQGQLGLDGALGQNPIPPLAPGTGIPFVRLTQNQPIEV